jgi:hypothetical protein
MGVAEGADSHNECLGTGTSPPYAFPAHSHCPMASELPYTCAITLTFARSSTLLVILHAILELAPVLCFNIIMATLPASTRAFSCSSSCLDGVEAFGETIAAKAALASTYIVEDFT